MHKQITNKGSAFVTIVLVAVTIVLSLSYLIYRGTLNQKTVLSTVKNEQQLLYLAELGIGHGFAELRNHGYNWFTHKVNGSNHLIPNHSCPPPSLKNVYLDAANVYVVYDDPIQKKKIEVKTYKSNDDILWIVSRATIGDKTKTIRLALGSRSLYDYFAYYSGKHFFSGANFDGRGFGKIYVNGNATFEGSIFKNIAEFSTNSTGVFKVYRSSQSPPYAFDKKDLTKTVDGYTFLRTYNGEFGLNGWIYPSAFASERKVGPKYPWHIFKPVNSCFSPTPTFIFDPNVMPETLANKMNLSNYTEVKIPTKLYDDTGTPANWDFDFYSGDDKGTGEATNEKPVKFVRLYYIDNNGYAQIVADPSKAPASKQVYAQVYDKKDTKKETTHITFLGKNIPVKEDGVPFKWTDKNGVEHITTFDSNYETYYWDHLGGWYTHIEDYIQNGYHRDTETVPVNYLDTSYLSQQNAFRDWLTGKYNKSTNPKENNTTLDLSHVIHEHATGAKDIQQPTIKTSFSNMAMYGGIWIGYEGNNIKVCTGVDAYGNPKCNVYSDPSALPEWLSVSEFYAGSGYKYESSGAFNIKNPNWENTNPVVYKVKIINLDLQKAQHVLNHTNGVIWLEPTHDNTKYGYDGIRLLNGETIPRNGGITVVSPRNIYVQGPLNKHDLEVGDPDWQPTALITDSYVVLLSKNFSPPTSEPPAYTYFPHPGGTNNEKWYEYLMYRFDEDPTDGFNKDNFWPTPKDDSITLKKKINEITKKIKEFIEKRHDKEFCDIDIGKFKTEFSKDPYSDGNLVKAINLAFTEYHHPDFGIKRKAMPLNHDGDYYLGASVVTSTWWCRGRAIQYLENRGWWYLGQYPQSDLQWRGSYLEIPGSWSGEALWYGGKYGTFGSQSYTNAKTYRIAENYNGANAYPPGNLSGGFQFIWYVDNDDNNFDKHPY